MTQARRSNLVMLKHPPERDGDICTVKNTGVPEGPQIGLPPTGTAVRRPDSSGDRGQISGWNAQAAARRRGRRHTKPIAQTPAAAV